MSGESEHSKKEKEKDKIQWKPRRSVMTAVLKEAKKKEKK